MSEEKPPRSLYLRQLIGSFGGGLINPYVTIYAVQLGTGPTEMGWLRSLTNFFNNMQIPWGMACDRLGRYIPFIVIGGVISSLLWLPVLNVTTPWQLILILSFQAIAGSMVSPAWAALLGRILPRSKRATLTANINAAASLGSIMATLLSGFLMAQVSGTLADRIRLPLLLAAVCGFGASLTMLTIQEKKQKTDPSAGRNWFDWRALKENRNFRTLVLFNLTHSFFMSMAWPLFPMTIVRIVKSDMLQVAYMSIISGSVSLFMRRYVGRLTDRAGRKPLIVLGRVGVAVYSLVYAFATEVYHIYIADFVSGIIAVSAEIAIFAYILDITTEEQRGASVAVHNTLMGISTFFGSILGGYLVVFFGQIGLNPDDALKASYIVSSLGRFLGGLLFLRVSEQYPYPSTVRKELVGLISEDMERTRYNIMRIEDMGEKADIDLMRDMEHLEPPSRQKKETEE